ncbi:Casparian strip membrane protein [Dioscorea alata]|uniref:Casparian strip membrane protein n=1 Tax=Dioscorea alata TaxID=55571 RepID=A0ACB7UC71_DIOAL|nr:Casparian strip membrane protein [Dioscorea alata]
MAGCRSGQAFFRALAAIATLTAALLMGLTQHTVDFGVISMHASYKSSIAFEFFMYGNAIASGYSLLSLLLMAFSGNNFFMHMLDMVSYMAMGGVMGIATGAAAIGYVGKYGNNKIGWGQVCPYLGNYCNKMMYSFGASYLGFILLFIVSLFSAIRKPN